MAEPLHETLPKAIQHGPPEQGLVLEHAEFRSSRANQFPEERGRKLRLRRDHFLHLPCRGRPLFRETEPRQTPGLEFGSVNPNAVKKALDVCLRERERRISRANECRSLVLARCRGCD